MNQDFEIKFKQGSPIEQIENACLKLYSIFENFALDANEMVDEQPRLPLSVLIHFSQFGYALVDSIQENLTYCIEHEKGIDTGSLLNTSRLFESESEIGKLAGDLSKFLNSPALPIRFYNAVQQAISEAYTSSKSETLHNFESSPEFIKAIIVALKDDES